MTDDFDVRLARPQDAASVAELVDAAYRHYVARIGGKPGPMRAAYAAVIRDHAVLVAERDGSLAGVLVLARTDEGLLVENVAVHPDWQGRGLGRVLLDRAEAEAAADGVTRVYLYTHELMTENRALYAHLGYVEYERRVDDGFARVFLEKRLD